MLSRLLKDEEPMLRSIDSLRTLLELPHPSSDGHE